MSRSKEYRKAITLIENNLHSIIIYSFGLLIVLIALAIGFVTNIAFIDVIATATTITYFVFLLIRISKELGLKLRIHNFIPIFETEMRKAEIQNDIENMINKYKLAYPLPDEYKLKWQNPTDRLDQDEVVIVLDNSGNPNHNMCLSALQYSEKTVIPYARLFIHDKVSKSIDYYVAEDILRNDHRDDAIQSLYEAFVERHSGEAPEYLYTTYNALSELRMEGLFATALLHEYSKLPEHGVLPPGLQEQTVRYLFELRDIAENDEESPMAYDGSFINVGIGIIGGNILERKYKKYARESIKNYETTYLVAEGENIDLGKRVYQYINTHPKVADHKDGHFTFSHESRFDDGYFAQIESSN
jgi:hypothetical protein